MSGGFLAPCSVLVAAAAAMVGMAAVEMVVGMAAVGAGGRHGRAAGKQHETA